MQPTAIGTDIENAAQLLRAAGLVAIPTETVYGLAANALDARAVARIFEAKDRPSFDPLIVHIPDSTKLSVYARNVPDWARALAEHFWPGPLTIVLPKKETIPDIVTSGLQTVGLRVPNHSMALSLLERLDFPLAAPSANPFGYISPTSAQHVEDQLKGKVDYILDGGACTVGVESTIIGEFNARPTIFRLGGISTEQIEATIGPIQVRSSATSSPAAPGMLESHYAPRKRVILGTPPAAQQRSAFLAFRNLSPNLPIRSQIVLSASGDLNEAARNVFAALRRLDAMDVETIYVELAPEIGLGRAINDRLRRASAERSSEVS